MLINVFSYSYVGKLFSVRGLNNNSNEKINWQWNSEVILFYFQRFHENRNEEKHLLTSLSAHLHMFAISDKVI